MKQIGIDRLGQFLTDAFTACGLNAENAKDATDIYLRATLRGVGHHDIYDLGGRLSKLRSGKVVPNPEYKPIATFQAMESWDVGGGLGEVVCCFAMDRAMALADSHGIGLCAIRNSNHFLAAAPYVERASERGYIAMILCKGATSMGAPDRPGSCMSALPMGFAYQTQQDYPAMLDICLAYTSVGQLRQRARNGDSVKPWWGLDQDGKPTTDSKALLEGTRFPIGGHKGFGLAMLGEVLTAVLSGGTILDQQPEDGCGYNDNSHTAIAIKADALMDMETFRERTQTLTDRTLALSPGLHLPGMGSHAAKERFLSQDFIDLDDKLIETLNGHANELGIDPLA